MLKLYKYYFTDGTHTYILAKDACNAPEAIKYLFPEMLIDCVSMPAFFPIADCRPPIAENVLTYVRQ